MANDVSVAFVRSENVHLNLTGGCAPAPTPFTICTIGGPRTEAQVLEEIEACEKALWRLRSELKTLHVGKDGDGV